MKKLLKKYTLFILLFIFAISPYSASASDYYIDNYDINIIVNENNTLDITEKIDIFFRTRKHGIYRKIPLKNKVVRLDGTTSSNRAKISNISVSDNYTLSTENGYKVIKIGDADTTLIGQKNYTINYTYNLGKDTGKDYDELYFNLIGDEWDTSISGVTFTIKMPKEFDKSKLGFSSGTVGSTNSSNITYKVNGNVITGSLKRTLKVGEALTVRLELPEGYFVGASNNLDLMIILSIVLPILFVLITLFLWYKYGKDNLVVETVEFYPPEGFNSAEIGFLYKGKAENEDVISLLIYLANKGYIKIVETQEKSLFSKNNSFKIIKLKEYDGNDENERLFLEGLFKNYFYLKNTVSKSVVTTSDLYNNFYVTLSKIIDNLNMKENKHKIYDESSLNYTWFTKILLVITLLLITIRPILEYGGFEILIYNIIFSFSGLSIISSAISTKTTFFGKILSLVIGLVFLFIGLISIFPALLVDTIYLITYIIGIICILIMSILIAIMPKRTTYGNEMLGKIRGFKRFLETAEKERLEAMVMQTPSYFYDILPYTYVLGVSDKWIKNFESIALTAPDWYEGNSSFDTTSFSRFIDSTMSSASSAMISSPSSSSGSSGGGSSGGGSGGGGGGSW